MVVKTLLVDPDPNNPRKDMGDLAALAATFTINPERPGEPINPPIVVKDGSRYRIVDGERRFRAMLEALQPSFTAIVADSLDDANTLLAMLATDDKKQLTTLERSIGVQQMLTLGITPEVVAKAARIDADTAASVNYALRLTKPKKPETLSLDQLAAEFDFPHIVEDFEEAIKESGLVRNDKAVNDYRSFSYVTGNIPTVKRFKEEVKKLKDPTGYVVSVYKGDTEHPSYHAPALSIYKKVATTKSGKPKKNEQELLIDRLDKQAKENRKVRAAWVAERINDYKKSLPNVAKYISGNLGYDFSNVTRFEERHGAKVDKTANALIIAERWGGEYFDKLESLEQAVKHRLNSYDDCGNYRNYIALLEAMVADGYVPSDSETEILDIIKPYIADWDAENKPKKEKSHE
jgi:hypothetical protein